MPTYATLVKLTPQALSSMGDPGKAYEEGKKMANQMGMKFIGAYATLGPYDMIFISQAPDEKVAAGMAMAFMTKWGGQTETWTLIPMEEFAQLAGKLKG